MLISPLSKSNFDKENKIADVAELADALASGASGHCALGGSTPLIRIRPTSGARSQFCWPHIGKKPNYLTEIVLTGR